MEELANRNAMKNINLWLRLDARGVGRVFEGEIASLTYETLLQEFGQNLVKPSDILGVQFLPPQQCWIIYMANMEAKMRLVSIGTLSIKNKQVEITDFVTVGINAPSTRISIHGIPMHVGDEEIAQWVDQYAIRDSPVIPAEVKLKGNNFMKLYSGNRYCCAKRIITPIPRYVKFLISDPLQFRKPNPDLLQLVITVYHDDQPVNCKKCLDLDHTFDYCPKRQISRNRQCHVCGEVGHLARNCDRHYEDSLFRMAEESMTAALQSTGLSVTGEAESPKEEVEIAEGMVTESNTPPVVKKGKHGENNKNKSVNKPEGLVDVRTAQQLPSKSNIQPTAGNPKTRSKMDGKDVTGGGARPKRAPYFSPSSAEKNPKKPTPSQESRNKVTDNIKSWFNKPNMSRRSEPT